VDEFPRYLGRGIPPEPLAITRLVASRTLDVELAALLWLLIEGRVPVLVAAGPQGSGKSTLLEALLAFQGAGEQNRVLRGVAEDFDWLPQAGELGWSSRAPAVAAGSSQARSDPARTTLLVHEFSAHLPAYTWEIRARVAVRALQLGYSLAGTLHAESLREVMGQLTAPPVSLGEDEVRRLGVVLILRAFGRPVVRRIVAAHYLRPLERDGQGHLQRRPPAVLATWDPESDVLDHFSWGLGPELAPRIGLTQADFERAQAARARFLAGLIAGGMIDPQQVRSAIEDFRRTHAPAPSVVQPAPNPPRSQALH
jgi:hypothetical protein